MCLKDLQKYAKLCINYSATPHPAGQLKLLSRKLGSHYAFKKQKRVFIQKWGGVFLQFQYCEFVTVLQRSNR